MWSLMRSLSTCRLGLLSSEGLTGAGGSALETAHVQGWRVSPGCSVQAAAPMVAGFPQKKQTQPQEEAALPYDKTSKVTQGNFCNILPVALVSPIQCGWGCMRM